MFSPTSFPASLYWLSAPVLVPPVTFPNYFVCVSKFSQFACVPISCFPACLFPSVFPELSELCSSIFWELFFFCYDFVFTLTCQINGLLFVNELCLLVCLHLGWCSTREMNVALRFIQILLTKASLQMLSMDLCLSRSPFFKERKWGEKVKVCQISQKLKNNGNRFNALNTNFKYLVHQYGQSYFNPPWNTIWKGCNW